MLDYISGPRVASWEPIATIKAINGGDGTMIEFIIGWSLTSLAVGMIVGRGIRFGNTGWP